MFQGLRPREVKTMRAQVTVSKALDRHSEETLVSISKSKNPNWRSPANRAPIAVLPTQLTPARRFACRTV